ncbi:MAG: Ig-like domain-containing protein [Peptococcaceae bacterium]|nr:Ig-like domain-containing protein [Peptococcaceae bacterium]
MKRKAQKLLSMLLCVLLLMAQVPTAAFAAESGSVISEITLTTDGVLEGDAFLCNAEVASVNSDSALTNWVSDCKTTWYWHDVHSQDKEDYVSFENDFFLREMSYNMYVELTAADNVAIAGDCRVIVVTADGTMEAENITITGGSKLSCDSYHNVGAPVEIKAVEYTVEVNAPAVGINPYTPVLTAVNGSDKEENMALIDSASDSLWLYSETYYDYSHDSYRGPGYGGKLNFVEGYAYALAFYPKAAENVSVFAEDCEVTLVTPSGKTVATMSQRDKAGSWANYYVFYNLGAPEGTDPKPSVTPEAEKATIHSLVYKVNCDTPTVGEAVYYPELYSINGSTAEEDLALLDEETINWYYSETYSENSNDYSEWYEKPYFDGALAYQLFFNLGTVESAAFADDCKLSIQAPESVTTLDWTYLGVGSYYQDYGRATFSINYDLIGGEQLPKVTEVVLNAEAASPTEGASVYYPAVYSVNGSTDAESLAMISTDDIQHSWYQSDIYTQNEEDYTTLFSAAAFEAGKAYLLESNIKTAEGVMFDSNVQIIIKGSNGEELAAECIREAGNHVRAMSYYNLGILQPVNSLEIVLDGCEVGENMEDITVTLNSNKIKQLQGYGIDYAIILSDDENADYTQDALKNDVFVFRNGYWLSITLQAEDGYTLEGLTANDISLSPNNEFARTLVVSETKKDSAVFLIQVAPLSWEITELVFKANVASAAPSAGNLVYEPELYSVNGKKDENTLKRINTGTGGPQWFASAIDDFETSGNYTEVNFGDAFQSNLGYQLYIDVTAVYGNVFTENSRVYVQTENETVELKLNKLGNDKNFGVFTIEYYLNAPVEIYVGETGMYDGCYLDNSGNITETMPTGGYAYYKNGVLTLDNYVYEGLGTLDSYGYYNGIYAPDALTIKLIGQNHITLAAEEDTYGVYVEDALRIEGTDANASLSLNGIKYDGISSIGNLAVKDCRLTMPDVGGTGIYSGYGAVELDNVIAEITAGHTGIYAYNETGNNAAITILGGDITIEAAEGAGLYGEDNGIIIEDGNITIETASEQYAGIESCENIVINGGTIDITATEYHGMYASNDIVINGGTVTAAAAWDGFTAGNDVIINDGTVLVISTAATEDDSDYQAIYVSNSFSYDDSVLNITVSEEPGGIPVAEYDAANLADYDYVKLEPGVSEIPVSGVTLDKTALELEIGDSETLTATVSPDNATDKTVIWTSSNKAVATVENGVVTAIAEGEAVITAQAGDKIATCNVTVNEPEPVVIPVSGVTLDKTALNMETGDDATLVATVSPDNATDKTVIWTSSNTAVATVENGVVTAIAEGEAVITAQAGDKTVTCNVTVNEPEPVVIPVSGVTLDKTALELEIGDSETLTATVSPDNATDKTVIWTSSNTAVATVENGVVTAIAEGEAVITAQAGDKIATCNVTVNEPEPPTAETYTVTVDGSYTAENGAGAYKAGDTVTIYAGNRSGYKFTGWISTGVTLTNKNEKTVTFIMPENDVTMTANWKKNISGGGIVVNPVLPEKPELPVNPSSPIEAESLVLQIGNNTILADGTSVKTDVAPRIIQNRTMLPVRAIVEILGGTVIWDADTQTVTLIIDGKTIIMRIGQPLENFDVAPTIIDGHTYVPLRYVAEATGAQVNWNGETKQISIQRTANTVADVK